MKFRVFLLPLFVASMLGCTEAQKSSVDLHDAALDGDMQALMNDIRAGANLDKRVGDDGSTALIVAVTLGKTEFAKALLSAGADPDFHDNAGNSAVHIAALMCRSELLQAMLSEGADAQLINHEGRTAKDLVTLPFEDVEALYQEKVRVYGPQGLNLDLTAMKTCRAETAKLLK